MALAPEGFFFLCLKVQRIYLALKSELFLFGLHATELSPIAAIVHTSHFSSHHHQSADQTSNSSISPNSITNHHLAWLQSSMLRSPPVLPGTSPPIGRAPIIARLTWLSHVPVALPFVAATLEGLRQKNS
ncbi:hypothetical protein AAEP93_011427 [Penicillium crustosum]